MLAVYFNWRPALLRYRVRLDDLNRHLLAVDVTTEQAAAVQDLTMPSWIPGSYLLREYARHVVAIRASRDGRAVPIERVDHSSWRVESGSGELTVSAKLYSLDQSVRGNYVDGRRAYFNGAAVFPLPAGHEEMPVELTLEPPRHGACENWRVATSMQPIDVDERGFGRYRAENYDELIDHPFEIGEFDSVEFEAGGVPHRLVVAGRFRSNLERVAEDLKTLCEYQIEFFGRPAPFDRYLFLGLAVGDGYGGLEHRWSSSLIFDRDDLPKPESAVRSKSYRRFLALASHEYFHSWHVKRSKPEAFMPYRLSERNFTRLLWVFEGITSYYQERMLLLSGLVDTEAYLQRLGQQLTRVYRTPGRFSQSLAESSFTAWDFLYKPEANHPNAGISYYVKGALVALALDLELRKNEDSASSLDEVVKTLWKRYGAEEVGVPEGGFEALAREMGGARLQVFFDVAIRGTEDLPLAQRLEAFGVKLNFRPRAGANDTGGTAPSGEPPELWLGAAFTAAGAGAASSRDGGFGLRLTTVLDGGPAQAAGLNPGDVLIAIDDIVVGEKKLEQRLHRYGAGDRVQVAVIRGDELLTMALTLEAAPADTCWLELIADTDEKTLARRRAWLEASEGL